ncbi:MAG: tripartite tricarboxylate transporter TctB family protein [Betaproteobacteria bacterium]|nr:tripartite tricarboxylate transporter TctB family protein [Betaproteobacteria bacterium]
MKADIISGLLFGVLGGVAANHARSFGLGTLAEPGSGFFPFWGGVMVAACSAAIVVSAMARLRAGWRMAPLPTLPAVPNWRKAVMCVAALLAYAALLPWIGFAISTFFTMLALSRFDPRTAWRGSIAIAGIGAAGFWLLFVRLLGVSFPQAPVGF